MEQSDSVITLRPLEVSDVDHFMAWAADPRVVRYCSWEPYQSREDAIRYIENKVSLHPYYRAICVGGRPVGSISVTRNQGKDTLRGELGYALAYEYWGRGIATEAVKMATQEAFKERKGELERVEALVDVENPASRRVLEKAGFVREGVLRKYWKRKGKTRDVVMFSRLFNDRVLP
ncbi:hypothetical protein MLD38_016926 [Melastoma candidum]|uniref:Uncharacterized protein n=1 Tax=Melastoma candidum TaxID=119954 RepID=A0ACB9QPJ7_9MYRT|nr:hypothetical protein MLD38_016926 [Melastoma candidum]